MEIWGYLGSDGNSGHQTAIELVLHYKRPEWDDSVRSARSEVGFFFELQDDELLEWLVSSGHEKVKEIANREVMKLGVNEFIKACWSRQRTRWLLVRLRSIPTLLINGVSSKRYSGTVSIGRTLWPDLKCLCGAYSPISLIGPPESRQAILGAGQLSSPVRGHLTETPQVYSSPSQTP